MRSWRRGSLTFPVGCLAVSVVFWLDDAECRGVWGRGVCDGPECGGAGMGCRICAGSGIQRMIVVTGRVAGEWRENLTGRRRVFRWVEGSGVFRCGHRDRVGNRQPKINRRSRAFDGGVA